MASAVQTIIDGVRNTVIKVTGSGAVTDEVIVDVSALIPACTLVKIVYMDTSVDLGITACLLKWYATSSVTIMNLNTVHGDYDFSRFGGLTNNAGSGVNGDITLTTVGTGYYSLIIQLEKAGTISADP